MSTKFIENMRELRKNPETSRAGLKWDDDEDDKMIAKLKDGVTFDDIAKELHRTSGSIKTRVIMNAIKRIDEDGDDPKTIATDYKITLAEIKEFREKKIQRDEKIQNYNNKNNNPTIKDLYNLMLEINNNLKRRN
tara:strand:- start:2403 stop:2807 length:405 start_codon:yes stop_codon:yes gene_type:complete